ncbi:MAG: response regulator [Bacteroidota bacterium]
MKKRIVVLDDDDSIQDLLRMIFERAGYEVISESDPEDVLKGYKDLPDIYLLDRQLAGADGLVLCDQLKHSPTTQHIPVIMVSASPDIGVLSKLAGANDYIEKPFRVNHLLNVVEHQIEKSHYH